MLQAWRGGAGGADILVCKIFLRSTVASMETYSTLCVSLCVCLRVCGISHAICKSYAQHILKIQQQQQERQRQQQQQQRQVHKT